MLNVCVVDGGRLQDRVVQMENLDHPARQVLTEERAKLLWDAEAIMALRSKWLSEDAESKHDWLGRSTTAVAA